MNLIKRFSVVRPINRSCRSFTSEKCVSISWHVIWVLLHGLEHCETFRERILPTGVRFLRLDGAAPQIGCAGIAAEGHVQPCVAQASAEW